MSARIGIFALVLAACGSEEGGNVAPVAASEVGFVAPITARLASHTQSPFQVRDPKAFGAKACAVGEVEQLEVTVCEFDAASSEAGQAELKKALAGAQSGAVRTHGALVVAIADRKKVDPRGQALNRVLADLESDDQKAN